MSSRSPLIGVARSGATTDAPDLSGWRASPEGQRGVFARRIAANTLVQAVGIVLGSLIGFGTFVAITRALGPAAFGNLTAASVFLFIPVVLADAGLSGAVLRQISKEPERTEFVMRASVGLRALVSFAVVTLFTMVGLGLPFSHQTKVAILISAPGAFFTLMNLSLLPVLQAQLRTHWAVVASVVGRTTTLALTLAALAAGLGFKSVVAAVSAGLAVTFLFDVVVVARLLTIRPILDLGYWRSLLRDSAGLGISGALAQIYFRIDAVLLALFRSPREVGLYGASYKFVELSETTASFASVSVFPTLTRLVAKRDPRAMRLVQRTFDLLLAAAAPITVVMLTLSSELLAWTAGDEFVDAAPALQLLAPYVLFSFVSGILWRVLVASHEDRALVVLSIAILGLNVVLNVVLIPLYGFKAAAATSVASQVVAFLLIAVAVQRAQNFWPSLRYVPLVAGAAAVMTLVILVLPGPSALAAAVGLAGYTAIVVLGPGAARQTLRELLSFSGDKTRSISEAVDP